MTDVGSEPIRVVVADDQRAIREALAMVLDNEGDISVVGQAADGDEAVGLAIEQGAQVVLMDLRMPGTDGVEATRRLTDQHPEIRVVVLTTYAETKVSARPSPPEPSAISPRTQGTARSVWPSGPPRPARRSSTPPSTPRCCAEPSSPPGHPPSQAPRQCCLTISPPETWTCFEA